MLITVRQVSVSAKAVPFSTVLGLQAGYPSLMRCTSILTLLASYLHILSAVGHRNGAVQCIELDLLSYVCSCITIEGEIRYASFFSRLRALDNIPCI